MLELLSTFADYMLDLPEVSQALIVFATMIVMIILGVPIPISVIIGTMIGYWFLDFPFVQIALSMYTGIEPFPLITIPLFVLAGSLMEQGGMARRIVNVAESLVGNYTGSLGLVDDEAKLQPRFRWRHRRFGWRAGQPDTAE